MPVQSQRKDYQEMCSKWKRLRDCEAGRDAVLASGKDYVPDLEGLSSGGNIAYRGRGNFYNAVARTIEGMNGVVFQKPPVVEFPETLKSYLTDISLTNVTFEMFASNTGKEVLLVGRYGILVDMSPAPTQNNRPFCVGYKAEDIVNWRTERRGGDEILSMVVLRESVEIPQEDPFDSKIMIQYRVVQMKENRCVQQLWRGKKDNAAVFEVFEEELPLLRRGLALDFVPFVFVGSIHSTPHLELPPLLDLADVNLGHWRNSVDHEYGLHMVALPTPYVSGHKPLPEGEKVRIGPGTVWDLDLQGTAGMLEFSGAGLGAIVIAMAEKKKQMASLGARLLEDSPETSETATAVRMRHSGEHASLRTIAGSIEQALSLALQIMAWWSGSEAKPNLTGVKVELNKEYLNIKASAQDVQVALTMLQAGEISYETFYALLQTGGWAREGIDAAAEREAIAKQALPEDPDPDPDPEE